MTDVALTRFLEEHTAADKRIDVRMLNALWASSGDLSLDGPAFADEEQPHIAHLRDEHIDLEGDLERQLLETTLKKVLGILDEREDYIIRCYFGLDGSEDITLQEIEANPRSPPGSRIRRTVFRLTSKAGTDGHSRCGAHLLHLDGRLQLAEGHLEGLGLARCCWRRRRDVAWTSRCWTSGQPTCAQRSTSRTT